VTLLLLLLPSVLQVGASQKLACVIDGESLMNDGSALVIFLLLQKIVEGEAVTVGGVSVTLLLVLSQMLFCLLVLLALSRLGCSWACQLHAQTVIKREAVIVGGVSVMLLYKHFWCCAGRGFACLFCWHCQGWVVLGPASCMRRRLSRGRPSQ
jgi:NhaP-type Na+/H+ or K+/H+ antiporter